MASMRCVKINREQSSLDEVSVIKIMIWTNVVGVQQAHAFRIDCALAEMNDTKASEFLIDEHDWNFLKEKADSFVFPRGGPLTYHLIERIKAAEKVTVEKKTATVIEMPKAKPEA